MLLRRSGEGVEGDFMQKAEAIYLVSGEERKDIEKKRISSYIEKTRKKILGFGIALFALSAVCSVNSFAGPQSSDEILVFTEEGGMVPQEDQTVKSFTEDALIGDTRTKGQQVVDYAMQFVGRPYRYGGLSLLHGSDCSGFLMGVFGHFGVSLPHSSGAIRSLGVNVGSLENAIPGDVLAYNGHVGIYLGNGKMLSALNAKSGVTVESATYKPIKSIRRMV